MDERRQLLPLVVLAMLVISRAAYAQQPASLPGQPAAPASPQTPAATALVWVPQTPEELGDALMAQQHYQAAIEAYKKGPRNDADLQNKLGIAYQMMFNVTDAMHCYQASLKLNPNNAKVLNNLGTIFDSQKQYGAAEKMYRRALKIEPHSAVTEKNLGTALLAERKFKKGAEAYQAALAIDPGIFENSNSPRVDNPASSQNRGAMNFYMAKSCIRAGMRDQAIEYLRMALNEGFISPKKIIEDDEFAVLRGTPAFEQLIAAQRLQ